jgi:hypothetical protein
MCTIGVHKHLRSARYITFLSRILAFCQRGNKTIIFMMEIEIPYLKRKLFTVIYRRRVL